VLLLRAVHGFASCAVAMFIMNTLQQIKAKIILIVQIFG
jgi:hypothetical protein